MIRKNDLQQLRQLEQLYKQRKREREEAVARENTSQANERRRAKKLAESKRRYG